MTDSTARSAGAAATDAPDVDGQAARIADLLSQLEATNIQLGRLMTVHLSTVQQLQDGVVRFDRIETILATHFDADADHRAVFESKLAALSAELQANTATTQVVRDTITTGRMMRRLVLWVAGILAAVGAGAYGVSQVADVVARRPPPADGIGPTP